MKAKWQSGSCMLHLSTWINKLNCSPFNLATLLYHLKMITKSVLTPGTASHWDYSSEKASDCIKFITVFLALGT